MVEALERRTAGDPVEAVVEGLDRMGAVIVAGLLDGDTLARFNAELDPHLEAVARGRRMLNPAIDWFMGSETRQLTGVAAISRVFAEEILVHPLLLGVCDTILLPSCARYQLNIAHVLDRGPGSEEQLLHRDELVWCHMPRPHPEIQVAAVIALEDFSEENGATRVVPGSHRWEDLERQAKPEETVAAVMKAGDAVVYLGSTIHGGGANVSSRSRRAMHLSYTLGWLRTEENNYLSATPDVVRGLPRRSQELLGYAVHDALAAGGGYLGTHDSLDPVELLQDGRL